MADSTENIKRYREILDLDPGSRVFGLLAEELCAAGEWKDAAEVCKKGLLRHPDHLRARMLLGWALMEPGESEESEQILAEAVEEVRKNGDIFKRLSELAAAAGKTESGAAYARLHEALGSGGPAEARTCEIEVPGAVGAPAQEVSEWDEFKSEAIENLDAEISDLLHDLPEVRKIRFEDILESFARGFEDRFANVGAPVAILSENDTDILTNRVIALLGA
jgi:tetratricopeptide (TPR) repeat protein